MLHYILQTVAFQLFFLIIYDLLLKKETFFNWNRFYLLFTALASVLLPFIKFEVVKTIVPQQFVVRLPEVIIGNISSAPVETVGGISQQANVNPGLIWDWNYLLYFGMAVAALILAYKFIKINNLIEKNPKRWKRNFVIISLKNSKEAFSFFNYVFLGEQIDQNEKETVLKHELVHVSQKHSWDLMFFEVLRILFWFNPLIYMYQSRIATLHEYIADEQALKQSDKKQYYEKLLSRVFDTNQISFTNTFFNQSLIKKRLVMLNKSKSNRINLVKYALLIPMIFGMLIYTSCQDETEIANEEISLDKYSYTLKMPGQMNDEQRRIHKEYESFLRNNPEYVAWAFIDYLKDEVHYSVHKKEKPIPEGFIELKVEGPNDEKPYTMFMNLKNSTTTNTSDIKFVPNDYEDAIEVPFSVIEEAPTLSQCNDLATNDEKRDCFRDFVNDFVNKNFNTNIAKEFGLTGRQRISVLFKIDKEGNIVDVMSRASHPQLEAEAIRVIKSLPQMIPGRQKGKTVVVPYSLPIIFQVSE
ncbi:M56 family metallopeptidase [Subsaxibacter sp. CAU 1640]|uniref:M56 family metallopeptidase n=1 Tax=Subsaxibacter sp. CAU 1640 TaxID=2933271 RepID=UPI002002F4DF|nr:M56 family metallopeptidase [Subsaxibacter sp. CAU 1640]MCK7589125.1 M56 family metallopeptidase [Subsaxibacter sp. CAU 1640]